MSDEFDSDADENEQFKQREVREAVSFLIEITPDLLSLKMILIKHHNCMKY